MGIGEQSGQFWPRQRGTAFVFNVPRRDPHPAFCGEGFDLAAGGGRRPVRRCWLARHHSGKATAAGLSMGAD